LLEAKQFDRFVEGWCRKFYAAKFGCPSLTTGHRHSLLIGYFEGIDSERGIAYRLAELAGAAALCGDGVGRENAGSLHDLAHAAAD